MTKICFLVGRFHPWSLGEEGNGIIDESGQLIVVLTHFCDEVMP